MPASPYPEFQMLLDALAMPCAVLCPDLFIVAVNTAYVEASGQARDKLVGRSLFDAFPANPCTPAAQGGSLLRASLERVLRSGKADVIDEFQYDIPDPSSELGAFRRRYWRVVNTPLFDAEGRVAWLLHQAEDVSERTQAHVARRKAEEDAAIAAASRRSLLDSVGEGFILLDREFRVLEINREGLRQDGRTAGEILGLSHWEAWPASAGSQIEDSYRRALRDQVPVALEHHYTGEGHDRWLDIRVYPSSSGLSVLFRDISGRKRDEQALTAARLQAEQANAAKSRFLAAASHDLRQPMQSLFLFTELLEQRLGTDGALSAIAMMKKSQAVLKDLLDSLFDVSRLDTGKVAPQVRDVLLDDLVNAIIAPYGPVAESKGVTMSFRCSPASQGLKVRTDPTLLTRMVGNLMENAIRYTDRGSITVACGRDEDGAWIEVEDTGMGIPPDQLDVIFDEFHQVGNPERSRDQGLGLGLSIVRRLSALLDHPVQVRSQMGRGSVFRISLPLAGQA